MSSTRDFYRHRYANLGHGQTCEANDTFHQRIAAALSAIGVPPRRVLDFGCAAGPAAAIFANAGHHVVGVDISESGIQAARARVPLATFELLDSESCVPFPDSSFDVCFCSEVIEHLFDVPGFIAEIHRLLVPDGCFLLTTPYHGWLKNLAIITLNFDRHFDPTRGHIRFFSRTSLTRCLQTRGFRIESVSGIGRPWPFWKSMFVVARKVG